MWVRNRVSSTYQLAMRLHCSWSKTCSNMVQPRSARSSTWRSQAILAMRSSTSRSLEIVAVVVRELRVVAGITLHNTHAAGAVATRDLWRRRERFELCVRQVNRGGGHVLFEMSDRRRTRYRQH